MEGPDAYKHLLRERAGLASLGRRGQNHFPMLQRVKIYFTPARAEYATDQGQTYSVDEGSEDLQIPPPRPRRPRFARPARPPGRNPTR